MTKPWEPIGCETLEYTNPLGDSVTFRMLAGVTGRAMPPISITSIPIPEGNGSALLGTAHLERVVTVPVPFPGTLTDRAELRRWAGVLDPTKGAGTLAVVTGPFAGRQLTCVYEAGLDELEETLPDFNVGHLLFRAPWPYWQEGLENAIDVGQGGAVHTWFPFLPLVLGASNAFGLFTVNNSGDVEAWPVVTVTGPGQEVTLTNHTTGLSWHVTGALAAGSTLVVDTRPGRKFVTIDGVNVYARLSSDSALWPLAPGLNQIEASMAATTAASNIHFAWRRQWLSA